MPEQPRVWYCSLDTCSRFDDAVAVRHRGVNNLRRCANKKKGIQTTYDEEGREHHQSFQELLNNHGTDG